MPDTLGFNHLGHEVACIDCGARGTLTVWTEKRRVKHFQAHEKERKLAKEREARRRAREARRLGQQARKENASVYRDRQEA